jgi:hypothetical protein
MEGRRAADERKERVRLSYPLRTTRRYLLAINPRESYAPTNFLERAWGGGRFVTCPGRRYLLSDRQCQIVISFR